MRGDTSCMFLMMQQKQSLINCCWRIIFSTQPQVHCYSHISSQSMCYDHGYGYLLSATVMMSQLPSHLLFSLFLPSFLLLFPPLLSFFSFPSCPSSSWFWRGGNNICRVSHWPFGRLRYPPSLSHSVTPCVFIPSPCSFVLHLQPICRIIQYIYHSAIW